MSELSEVLQAISNLDKKVDVHIAKQTEICEAAKCMRHTHDLILFGDGSNPDVGLVGSHQRVKSQVEEQGRSIGRLEISVDRLVMGVWGVVLLVVIAAATLVWTRVTEPANNTPHSVYSVPGFKIGELKDSPEEPVN